MCFPCTVAPKHSFHAVDTYPALLGATYMSNVTFAHYKNHSCKKDVALLTNHDADDGIHPIFTKNVTFIDTPENNYLFMHQPNLANVNPSDCVDMDCDGLKKVVIQDMDGSLLGRVNATLTAQAEFEWDGDRSRGIGDYRIPVSLRQNLNGTVIPASAKYPNKGIVRDSSCSLMPSWRAWKCTNVRHRMMVIESLDADTEVRRLSPIGLIANPGPDGYVDLLNGPMDRGWCMGYTCQERISTFYSIVASNYTYEMAMTSTPPQVSTSSSFGNNMGRESALLESTIYIYYTLQHSYEILEYIILPSIIYIFLGIKQHSSEILECITLRPRQFAGAQGRSAYVTYRFESHSSTLKVFIN